VNYDNIPLTVNAEAHDLEMNVDGNIAIIEYELSDGILKLIHTEVPPVLEGKGVGSAIVLKALNFAKENNYKIVPICPFVQAYLKRHPQWNEIINPAKSEGL